MKKIFLGIILMVAAVALSAQKLQFHKNGTFKIAQFTDTHWDNNSKNCAKTLHAIQSVLEQENPDFVVFTGDIVTSDPVIEGWKAMTKPIIEAKIPWTIAFGNHDEEMNVTKKDAFAFLQTLPYFMGEVGEVSGVGNFSLPIYSSTNQEQIANLMYIFDSHDYTGNPVLGDYDWIKFDQIEWYRKTSSAYTKANKNFPIPSVAFFHIPLLEFNDVANQKELKGYKGEGIASAEVNSGLFAAFVEQKDVMGVFVGHDHENNYIGITKNIALGFGQATGADAYGELERGGRIIELKEGKFAFKTWIVTPSEKKHDFYYPSGLSEITAKTKVEKATAIQPTKQGVKYKYYEYEGKIKSVDEIANFDIAEEGVLPNISIKSAKKLDYYAFTFEAWLKIPETAHYKFYTYSDDGSKVFIDGKLVVNNDGGHSAKRENGEIALEKGFHKLEIKYFESYMGEKLRVGLSSISLPETEIPNELLFVE